MDFRPVLYGARVRAGGDLDDRSGPLFWAVHGAPHAGGQGQGEFDWPTGTITFDPADFKTLKVDVSFDTKSVNTRNPDRDKDLRSDLFFDIAKYPKMTFKSKRAEPSGPGRLKLIGDLTIKGVTKEVTLEVEGPTPEIKDIWGERRIGATATTTIDRRQFGLMYNRMLEGGGAVVGDTVNVTIDVEMTRKGG